MGNYWISRLKGLLRYDPTTLPPLLDEVLISFHYGPTFKAQELVLESGAQSKA